MLIDPRKLPQCLMYVFGTQLQSVGGLQCQCLRVQSDGELSVVCGSNDTVTLDLWAEEHD